MIDIPSSNNLARVAIFSSISIEQCSFISPPKTIETLVKMLRKSVEIGTLKDVNVEKLVLYLWSVVHGATYVSHSVVFYPSAEMSYFGAADDFQRFVIALLKEQLEAFI
ncbi:MAG: hypothetical protein HGN29_01155 [Asgard group archaeon]|nr:hypothetical protein [Asgard group archaeon]